MEINREAKAFDEGAEVFLGENAGNHSGQNVSCPAGCHARIAGWVDVNRSIRRGHDGPVTLQDEVCIPSFRELLGDLDAIG